jgi:hypothetical protein
VPRSDRSWCVAKAATACIAGVFGNPCDTTLCRTRARACLQAGVLDTWRRPALTGRRGGAAPALRCTALMAYVALGRA